MKLRLIIAITSTVLEEALVAFLFVWLPPQFEIQLPISLLIVILTTWTLMSILLYRVGSKALDRHPLNGLDTMLGSHGVVICRLAPEGMIRIGNETWIAKSEGRNIEVGEEVVVTAQDGLRLTVAPVN